MLLKLGARFAELWAVHRRSRSLRDQKAPCNSKHFHCESFRGKRPAPIEKAAKPADPIQACHDLSSPLSYRQLMCSHCQFGGRSSG